MTLIESASADHPMDLWVGNFISQKCTNHSRRSLILIFFLSTQKAQNGGKPSYAAVPSSQSFPPYRKCQNATFFKAAIQKNILTFALSLNILLFIKHER